MFVSLPLSCVCARATQQHHDHHHQEQQQPPVPYLSANLEITKSAFVCLRACACVCVLRVRVCVFYNKCTRS